MEESLAEVREQEEEMTRANRALTTRLEDVQVRPGKPNSELKLARNHVWLCYYEFITLCTLPFKRLGLIRTHGVKTIININPTIRVALLFQ